MGGCGAGGTRFTICNLLQRANSHRKHSKSLVLASCRWRQGAVPRPWSRWGCFVGPPTRPVIRCSVGAGGVLHAGGQREAGLLQRVLAAASTGGRGRSSRRPFLCVEFTNLSPVVGADAYRGRELLLPVMGESAPQLGRGREHAVADGQRERAPVGPAGSPVSAGGLPQVR